MPDKKSPEDLLLYVTAINKTTGDSLLVSKSVQWKFYTKKRLTFNLKPEIAAGFNLWDSTAYVRASIPLLKYKGKKIEADLFSTNAVLNLSKPSFGMEIIRIRF